MAISKDEMNGYMAKKPKLTVIAESARQKLQEKIVYKKSDSVLVTRLGKEMEWDVTEGVMLVYSILSVLGKDSAYSEKTKNVIKKGLTKFKKDIMENLKDFVNPREFRIMFNKPVSIFPKIKEYSAKIYELDPEQMMPTLYGVLEEINAATLAKAFEKYFDVDLVFPDADALAKAGAAKLGKKEQVAKQNTDIIMKATKGSLPTYAIPRNIERKVFAKTVREMFKKLGIKGASVTTPDYSMASSIDIAIPVYYIDVYDSVTLDRLTSDAGDKSTKLHEQIKMIMANAFPTMDDKSDTMTDYFDFKYMLDLDNLGRKSNEE